MTKSEMEDTLRELDFKLFLAGYTLPQHFEELTELGRMISCYAYEYGRQNTRKFISISERALMQVRVDHRAEDYEGLKAYYLKAVEIHETWSADPPPYEDEPLPPYTPFPPGLGL